jgi:hypothetical protein
LLSEGIEPNPGPIYWGIIERGIKEYYGGIYSEEHDKALANLLIAIKKENNLTLEPILADHIEPFLASNPHPMKGAILEVIVNLKKQAGKTINPLTITFLTFSCSHQSRSDFHESPCFLHFQS